MRSPFRSSVTLTSSSLFATLQPGEPTVGYMADASVWFTWTAPQSGALAVSTAGTAFDTGLALYSSNGDGTVGGLSPLTSNDNCGYYFVTTSCVFAAVSAGDVVVIQVDGVYGASGDVQLTLSLSPPPANDDFVNRVTLSGADVTASGYNTLATEEVDEPMVSWTVGPSVWYQWTAPSSGVVSIDTYDSTFDTTLGVYDNTNGALSGLALVSSSDNTYYYQTSHVSVSVSAGATFVIQVSGVDSTAFGDIVLHVTMVVAPVNDDFAHRVVLSGDAVTVNYTLAGSTFESGEQLVTAPNPYGCGSTWYSWSAPSSGSLVVDTSNGGSYSIFGVVFVYEDVDGTIAGAVLPTSEATPGVSYNNYQSVSVIAGKTYAIQVQGFYVGSDVLSNEVVLTLSIVTPPVNDAYANAVTLTSSGSGSVVSATGSCVGATFEWGEPMSNVGTAGSIWYTWTAPTSGTLYANTTDPDPSQPTYAYTMPFVYTQSSGGADVSTLVSLQNYVDYGQVVAVQVTQGTTYAIQVEDYSWSTTGIALVALSTVATPSNDDFIHRRVLTGSTVTVSGSTVGATVESGESIYMYGPLGTIWYSWTATNNDVVNITTDGSAFDTFMVVYADSGAGLWSLRYAISNDDCTASDGSTVTTSCVSLSVSTGQTYAIQVQGKGWSSGAVTLAVQLV